MFPPERSRFKQVRPLTDVLNKVEKAGKNGSSADTSEPTMLQIRKGVRGKMGKMSVAVSV